MASPICTDCPPPAELRRLINGTLEPDEQSRLTAHLDCCESCQQAIEHVAAGSSGFLDCACGSDQTRPGNTSAYWPAVRQLEREIVKIGHGGPLSSTRSGDDTADRAEDLSLDFLDPPEEPGTLGKLGRFHVVELIGRGGMGVVLRALDVCLQRQVAIKLLDPLYAKNELARNRFIREARAAASIAHENVVAVHHVEKHREEIPFLVMRLVTGQSLQDLLDARSGPLEVREMLEIGRQMAAGLAAAHEQTLIHRDIKPANILLESGTGKVLLTDFGLARASEDVKLTQTGFVAGTPLYMSPEQARGETLDHRSDLFSMGSVLYAMCTGSPPFKGSSAFVVLREVTEGHHQPVREINPKVPAELADIIDHLLAKKSDERIQSAAEVAERLGNVLASLPIDAATLSPSKRSLRKLPRIKQEWWKRAIVPVALVVLALNALLALSEAAKVTHWTVLGQRGQVPVAAVIPPGDGAQTILPEIVQKPRLPLEAENGPVWSVAFSPDGDTVATGLDDGSVRLWNAHTGQLKSRIVAQQGPVWKIAFNNDGTIIATVSDEGNVRLWNTSDNTEFDTIKLPGPVRAVAFSPDGTRLVVGTRQGLVRVYQTKGGDPLMTMPEPPKGVVMALAWSADGKLVAAASGDHTVKIWDVSGKEAKEVDTLTGHTGGVHTVAFDPDPTKHILASGSWDRTIRLWDIEKGKEIRKIEGHQGDVWSVAFSSDGTILASSSEDRTTKLWDPNTGKELRTFKGQMGSIYGVSLSPDGKTLATASRDGTVDLWDVENE